MNDLHGIVYAFRSPEHLGELVGHRTGAAIPICGRYRAIDFSLSMLSCAGVRGVGVIMQRDYQSLIDHIGSGKAWGLSRLRGGLHLLPPYGLPDARDGDYRGCMEALYAVSSYIREVPERHIALLRGDMVANLDLEAAFRAHIDAGADVTALCRARCRGGEHHELLTDSSGRCEKLLCGRKTPGGGLELLESYIIRKDVLLRLIGDCAAQGLRHFHRDALQSLVKGGGDVRAFVCGDYARRISSVREYMAVNMDMLEFENRARLFPASRPVRTNERADVSTCYGAQAVSHSCLVADGCYIEGNIENCVIFRGVRIGEKAVLRDCVVMQDCVIGAQAILKNVIADKEVTVTPYTALTGSRNLPLVIPRGETV